MARKEGLLVAGTNWEIKVISCLVGTIEDVLFPWSDDGRGGYVRRGVTNALRMIGHVELVDYIVQWTIKELGLKLDPLLASRLCRIHDLHKAVLGDRTRIPESELGRPTGRLTARIKRFLSSGRSLKERRAELAEAIEALRPRFESCPELWEETLQDLRTYFLWPRVGGQEARFVWAMSEVADVWIALWYARTGRMEATPRNIRTFTDEFGSRLSHRIAGVYWKVLKERYIDVLLKVYRTRSIALAQ